jgi:hypothetical protein
MPITVSGTTITFNDATTQSTAATGVATPLIVVFNSSNASYANPGTYSMVRIEVWGGGGGSSRGSPGFGGGGGGYNTVTVPKSYLTFPLAVTIGTGGAAGTVNDTQIGGVGGTSQVNLNTAYNGRTAIQAFGGGGGGRTASCEAAGIGGGQLAAGGQIINGARPGSGAYNGADGQSSGSTLPSDALFGGAGGNTFGAGAPTSQSVYGGNGGALGAGAAGNGVQPGGGGATANASNTTGGAGAAGRVVLTFF